MAAIYQWYVDRALVLTTTLYPIEVVDALQLGGQLGNGNNMLRIPNDMLDFTEQVLTVSWRQLLKEQGPNYESLDFTEEVLTVSWRQLLKEQGPNYEALDFTEEVLTLSLRLALVVGDTPDEGMLFACELSTVDCSMTPV